MKTNTDASITVLSQSCIRLENVGSVVYEMKTWTYANKTHVGIHNHRATNIRAAF